MSDAHQQPIVAQGKAPGGRVMEQAAQCAIEAGDMKGKPEAERRGGGEG